jgi:transcriptional regulator EpsA
MGSNSVKEALSQDALLTLFGAALSARSQLGWSQWLQGEIQAVLPHHALIAAWGDFASGDLAYDVITRSPGLSMHALSKDIIEPLAQTLFDQWIAAGQVPLAVDTRCLSSAGSVLLPLSPCVMAHGVQDRRSGQDCLYIFVGPDDLASIYSRNLCRMALPFIDTAFRQLSDRGQPVASQTMSETGFSNSSFAQCGAVPADSVEHGDPVWGEGQAGERGSTLSARELEVMEWVRMGKTNSEIAIILNLSMFTVKNHMRRIYRKLDVLNRAQAVGCLDRMRGSSHHPVGR